MPLITTYEVEVTEEDIKQGEQYSTQLCAVALAASRALGRRANCGFTALSVAGKDFHLPEVVSDWIKAFDASKSNVGPIKFEMTEFERP